MEIPEELLGNPGLTVFASGSSLAEDEPESGYWLLQEVPSKVVVHWQEDGLAQEAGVDVGLHRYLLFKLSGRSSEEGRLVNSPSTGSYLVVTPEGWERDEELSGPPPVVPEPVNFAGYRAHFFELDKRDGSRIAFRLPDGLPLVIEGNTRRFELIGNRIEDAGEDKGPLFGEKPPRIRASTVDAWKNVRTIVVGEEGRGKGKWRAEVNPDSGQTEQELPPEVAARKGGWYFARLYDDDDELIESFDFRFLSALKKVSILQASPLPPEGGHEPVCVEFLHEPGCIVEPQKGSGNIQVERPYADKTVLIVPPDPACDESQWLVGPVSGPKVEVTVRVERVWWALGEESTTPSEWRDRPVLLSREDLKAASSKALWLRLPKERWVRRVLVGFEHSKSRHYDVRVSEKAVVIPLRDYSDSAEAGDKTGEHNLRLWIQRSHQDQDMEVTVAVLPASAVSAASVSVPAAPTLASPWIGVGRFKSSKATAEIRQGASEIKVNGAHLESYFERAPSQAKQFLKRLLSMSEVGAMLVSMQVSVTVEGSDPTTMRQAKAVTHAIARALMNRNPRLRPLLRQAGFGGVHVETSKARRNGQR